MFMAALFITAQKCKHLTHPPSCKWATKGWCIHDTMKYHSAIKKKYTCCNRDELKTVTFSEPHVKDHTVDTFIMFNIKSLEKQIYRDRK